MSYSSITFEDGNQLKRWLQRKRLDSAIKLANEYLNSAQVVVDFGAGNGELLKILGSEFNGSSMICYEPTHTLLEEAKKNLHDMSNVSFFSSSDLIGTDAADVIFCLEVFEHLPETETLTALSRIEEILKNDGIAIIGVPVEVGFPALYKGIFRRSRRSNTFDTKAKNILACFLGRPPVERPISEIAPGIRFYFEHTGFDHRLFRTILNNFLDVTKITTSPYSIFGTAMPEVYFVARKSRKL